MAIAENDFAAAHSELSAADPNNPMLAMDLDELANSLSGVMISPFAAILEIYFGTNEKGPARGGGGVGVGLAGPAALPTGDIVRRIAGGTGLER